MINQSDKDGDGEINVDESYRIMKMNVGNGSQIRVRSTNVLQI
jgi:hypothetical protein